jgi:hypothetical protein
MSEAMFAHYLALFSEHWAAANCWKLVAKGLVDDGFVKGSAEKDLYTNRCLADETSHIVRWLARQR